MKINALFTRLILAFSQPTCYGGFMDQQEQADTLTKIVQHLAVAQTYLSKAAVLVAGYQEAVAPMPLGSALRGTNSAIHSLQMWAEYLAEHGPTERSKLHEATGQQLTKSGYDRTQAWVAPMTYMADDALPADAVLRIKGLSDGVGRPPTIYFLWCDRWDVLAKFGVGPIKPDNMPARLDAFGLPANEWDEPEPTGTYVGVTPIPEPADESELVPMRFPSMEEWDAAYATQFDVWVATETKPTDEEKQRLRDTVPEGADANAAIAIAHRAAVERARQTNTLLGVVQPPEQETDLTA